MGGDVYRRFCVAAVQSAPVFLDRDASISRLEQWAAKAKAAGADLIVFGESYIPAFPLWNMLYASIDQHAFYCRLYATYTDIVEERRLSRGNGRVVGNADAPTRTHRLANDVLASFSVRPLFFARFPLALNIDIETRVRWSAVG